MIAVDLRAYRLQLLADFLERPAAALGPHAVLWITAARRQRPGSLYPPGGVFRQASDSPQNPVAWLYRVVRNLNRNAARAPSRREHHRDCFVATCCDGSVRILPLSTDAETLRRILQIAEGEVVELP